MPNTHAPTLIGIDGGGTTCRIAILCGEKRSEIKGGRANVSTDRDSAIRTIREGLSEAAKIAGLTDADLPYCHAYLGLAGVVGDSEARYVALHMPFDRVLVQDDRSSAVVGALGDKTGTVAGIGTGSFMARKTDESLKLIGGWGFVLGDEGSGGWLGRKLLGRVLQSVDGLVEQSPLSEALLDELGGTAGIVRYSLSAAPRDFAGFAPRLLDAAKGGDTLALGLMAEGARYIDLGARSLGWQSGEPFCLIGGLASHYGPYLPEPLAASMREPVGTALDGTLRLAAQIALQEGTS